MKYKAKYGSQFEYSFEEAKKLSIEKSEDIKFDFHDITCIVNADTDYFVFEQMWQMARKVSSIDKSWKTIVPKAFDEWPEGFPDLWRRYVKRKNLRIDKMEMREKIAGIDYELMPVEKYKVLYKNYLNNV